MGFCIFVNKNCHRDTENMLNISSILGLSKKLIFLHIFYERLKTNITCFMTDCPETKSIHQSRLQLIFLESKLPKRKRKKDSIPTANVSITKYY